MEPHDLDIGNDAVKGGEKRYGHPSFVEGSCPQCARIDSVLRYFRLDPPESTAGMCVDGERVIDGSSEWLGKRVSHGLEEDSKA